MIFDNPFFTEILLPFLLVFVVTFAILQKSKILANTQVDAMVGLVIGLILIGVPGPRDVVVGIMPLLAVGVAVILVFMILYGFVAGDLSDDKNMPGWLKYTFMGLAALFTIWVVLFVSGLGTKILDSFGGSSDVWMNIVMIVLVVAVVAVAMKGGKSGRSSSSS
jgi:predicted Abi (CAAX) family protease